MLSLLHHIISWIYNQPHLHRHELMHAYIHAFTCMHTLRLHTYMCVHTHCVSDQRCNVSPLWDWNQSENGINPSDLFLVTNLVVTCSVQSLIILTVKGQLSGSELIGASLYCRWLHYPPLSLIADSGSLSHNSTLSTLPSEWQKYPKQNSPCRILLLLCGIHVLKIIF